MNTLHACKPKKSEPREAGIKLGRTLTLSSPKQPGFASTSMLGLKRVDFTIDFLPGAGILHYHSVWSHNSCEEELAKFNSHIGISTANTPKYNPPSTIFLN